jgi:hypothetical protein
MDVWRRAMALLSNTADYLLCSLVLSGAWAGEALRGLHFGV